LPFERNTALFPRKIDRGFDEGWKITAGNQGIRTGVIQIAGILIGINESELRQASIRKLSGIAIGMEAQTGRRRRRNGFRRKGRRRPQHREKTREQ